ncbi:MAG: TolC family protein [Opitutae bacterium]|nr:TolC family protein [Opitutae bacterium]
MKVPSQFHFPILSFLLFTLTGAGRAEEPNPLAIDALVSEITSQNPELKFYEAEIDAAKAGRRSAGSLANPELSLDVGHKRVRDAAGSLAGEGTAWAVSVRQSFEWPGRLDLRKAIANRQLALAELGLARFKLALTARARALAYGLYAANTKAQAVREVADRLASLKEVFLSRESAGITPLLETRVIEASELALQRRAGEAELALQSALIELNQLRGASPEATFRINAPELKFSEIPGHDVLVAASRENNFEFRMRRVELEQQGFEVGLARNERYPAINVGPTISRETAGDRETVIGLSLSVPLPLTSRARGAVDLAEARRRQAEVVLQVAERNLVKDVLIATHTFATKLAESRRWSPDAIGKFREAADLADRHYRLGAVPVATYIELQNAYLEAVEALLDTQREALDTGLRLQELTGLDFNPVETKS